MQPHASSKSSVRSTQHGPIALTQDALDDRLEVFSDFERAALCQELSECKAQLNTLQEENRTLFSFLPHQRQFQLNALASLRDGEHGGGACADSERPSIWIEWKTPKENTDGALPSVEYGGNWGLSAWSHVLNVLSMAVNSSGDEDGDVYLTRIQPFGSYAARDVLRRGRDLINFGIQYRELNSAFDQLRVKAVSLILRSQNALSGTAEDDRLCEEVIATRAKLLLSHHRRVDAGTSYMHLCAEFDRVAEQFLTVSTHEFLSKRDVRQAGKATSDVRLDQLISALARCAHAVRDLSQAVVVDCAGVGEIWESQSTMMCSWLTSMVEDYQARHIFPKVSFADAKGLLSADNTLREVSVVQARGEEFYSQMVEAVDRICACFLFNPHARGSPQNTSGAPEEGGKVVAMLPPAPYRDEARSAKCSRKSTPSSKACFADPDPATPPKPTAEVPKPTALVATEPTEGKVAQGMPSSRSQRLEAPRPKATGGDRGRKRVMRLNSPGASQHADPSVTSGGNIRGTSTRNRSTDKKHKWTPWPSHSAATTEWQEQSRSISPGVSSHHEHREPDEAMKCGVKHMPLPKGSAPRPSVIRQRGGMTLDDFEHLVNQLVRCKQLRVPKNFAPCRDESKSRESLLRESLEPLQVAEVPYNFGSKQIVVKLVHQGDAVQVAVRHSDRLVSLKSYCEVYGRSASD